MSDNFCHLHGHSYFSMLDGLGSIEQIFQKAKDLHQEYIAVTDHGSMYGIVPAAVESKKTGIKLIHGFEAYVVKDASIKDKSERSSESEVARKHLILLAKDNEGYKRLMKICSWGMCEGFYYRPRIDDSILEKYGTEGLIASSACFVPSKYLTVITKSEVKNLLDVNAADLVKTHTGEWKFVIAPTTRYYEGNLYTVYIANEFPMTVTENHKFLVLRENTQKISDNYKYLSLWYNSDEAIDCLTNHSWIERYRGSYVPEWLKVQNIQQGDFLLYPINMEKLNIEETRQYILSQIDNFTFSEQDLNYHLISTSLNYVCNIRDKLNQLLVYSWIYDQLGYYELVLDKCKLEQIKENKLCPTNMMEMPFEFEGKLYLRRRVYKIEQSFDKIRVHCLNVNQDHSFVINNVISHNCFVPSNNLDVLTKDGIKNLLDVKTGDYVQSHTGEWQKVIIPTTREYEGNFYTIKVQGGLPLTVTENHKFFIITPKQLNNPAQYPLASYFDQINIHYTANKWYRNIVYRQNMRQFIPQEIEVKNIKPGDYVISSIDETINDIQEIDISFIYREQCKKHLKTYKLRITKELLELLGIYIAEGSLNICTNKQYGSGINFSLNIKDQSIQNKVQQYMLNIFNLMPCKHQNKDSDCIIYSYISHEIYELFASWFKQGAEYKHIPNFIKYLPFNKQMYCIKGILIGDGHIAEQLDKRNNKKHTRIIFNTISKQLVYDMTHILNRNWINPSLKFKPNYIDKTNTHHQDSYYLYINNPIATHIKHFLQDDIEFYIDYKIWRKVKHLPFEWNGKKYLKYPIKSIQSFYDKKRVYCLSVENDHSFTICNIKVSNCIAGSISQYILHDDYEAAKKEALRYQQLFHGDFYLELMPHKHLQEQANRGLLKIHEETNIPLILTSDFHYINQEDKEAHEVLLCAQQKTTLSDPNRWKFEEGFYYIMSRDEIIEIFQKHHPYIPLEKLKEAADNTVKIAEQCNVEIKMGHHYLPKIDPYVELKANPQLEHEFNMFESRRLQEIALHNNITIDEAKNRVDASNEYLRFLTIHGWHGMYQQDQLNAKHISLLMHELDIIQSLGFASYFLLLEEILAFCAKENIATGSSRGCFSWTNKVNTLNRGLVNINQITINDQVLGLDNQYHQVLQTYEYDCDEDLIQIETESNKIIEGLTKDHKVLGLKKEDYVEGKEYTINDFKWYKIDELDVNDYIVEI